MAFEYINNETREILDISSRRYSRTVKAHFKNRYSLKERRKVKTITVDMNTDYISMIQVLEDNYQVYQALLEEMTHTIMIWQSSNDLTSSPFSVYVAIYANSMKTLLKYLPHIQQPFKYPFYNGRIEGINHKIKVLTNLAYGYRNF